MKYVIGFCVFLAVAITIEFVLSQTNLVSEFLQGYFVGAFGMLAYITYLSWHKYNQFKKLIP